MLASKARAIQVNQNMLKLKKELIRVVLRAGARFPGGSEDCLKVNIYTPFGVKPNAKRECISSMHLQDLW